ncbi:GDP-mannose 4,6-dehydratase [Patescibacteria group bacterium]|nr:GDP-mannose 4,6-dehydratase [Patescibacteria group bacterium]MBU1663375.1 GDP-mannose 4,6-dehydratase [Patescibacteria group bacterium]MBU1934336.1 GDP-mannose 4,6-dehydratase [Patescibacteria group bacterium]MBU2007617.1 GDP-mannose 4,6-dehydratase [Patescibacteria group bacterium]MBU2233374.1 GDP-mannose 4,6-dehydratase [Patescibacteria group bacterium]
MGKRAIFNKKNVLVTGGAGFIGSHLCDRLIENSKVICLDNFSTGDERNIDHLLSDPNFEFIKHDITQPIDLEKLSELQKFKIEFQGIQEIYNLACPTSPKDFDKNKIPTILALSYGLKNVLDLAIRYHAKIAHFSSSVVYGPRLDGLTRIKESEIGKIDFLSSRSSYDEGKRFAETMVENYRQVYNIDAKVIRLFRIYGPRMKLNEGNLIPDFVNSALENTDLIIPGDENFSSSLCYISDCIDACLKLMESNVLGPINIGSDVDMNLLKICDIIIKILNSKSKVTYADKHLFISELCLPDITKAREELGWMPIVTLENGLKKTIDDLRASKGLKTVI